MPRDTIIYDDPVAHEVEDHLRETGMIPLAWETAVPERTPSRTEMILRFPVENYIRLTDYGTATCCVLVRGNDDYETAKREAPAKILAELEKAASQLRKVLER